LKPQSNNWTQILGLMLIFCAVLAAEGVLAAENASNPAARTTMAESGFTQRAR